MKPEQLRCLLRYWIPLAATTFKVLSAVSDSPLEPPAPICTPRRPPQPPLRPLPLLRPLAPAKVKLTRMFLFLQPEGLLVPLCDKERLLKVGALY
jgi:hypothetical protein